MFCWVERYGKQIQRKYQAEEETTGSRKVAPDQIVTHALVQRLAGEVEAGVQLWEGGKAGDWKGRLWDKGDHGSPT